MLKYRNWFLVPLVLVAAAVFFVLDPEKSPLFPKCPFYILTGWYCPGCGSQRAVHSFLHGRFDDVIAYNFLVFPAALLILYHYAHRWLNRFLGWKLPDILYLRNTPSVILAVVLIFWIARNIPVTPFTWLSP
ncbi:MAG: DUF2752 domain-containing protein [Prolixibacteraceae bacterium]|jgi:hypothetical protein|nr:DUF2752 domain-containing protein [Prolixibacteraceae bacterium]MDI9564910.1 DUF2752 domain-containing protein [Bacteroidota bacterium]NLT00717.1 DUF2752 domain-containing protein [Bacteroidales bacterium]OQB78788.1 MAG: hypothetical protein BWX87_02519 [Bacteroidetes bacterium ADurb.Bin123]HNU79074.1 DUF2752 domain-containing protein [Prolixibacteraceae bacterium]